MKKFLFFSILIFAALISNAADRSLRINTGMTQLNRFTLGASDTINESDTITFTITNLQKYAQMQVFTVGLTDVDGTPDVTITAYGKVTSAGSWVQIGTPISWASTSDDGDISSTSPINYNYLKVVFLAGAGAQQTLISTFEAKTSNAYDIPANSGTLTVSRATEGTVTITSADNNANAALTIAAGGTGALTLGDVGSTTAITSSDWAIDATGAMTGIGAITSNGAITGTSVISPLYDASGAVGITIGSADVTKVTLSGISEDLVLTPSADTWTATSSTGVTTVDFGTLNLATDALDLSEGDITNGGSIAIDAITADGTNITVSDPLLIDTVASLGSWGYTGEHIVLPETSSNTNAGLGIYSMVDYSATAGKVFAGTYSRALAMTTNQTNQSTIVGAETQFRLRDVDVANGVHAGLWAYAEQSGTSTLSGNGTFNAISATVESEATFTVGATENISCIVVDGSINAGATIDADAEYSGIHIKSNGKDFYNGIHITGSTNDIELGDGSCVDGSTTNGATHNTATGVTNINYSGALNRTVITLTDYVMTITDSEGNGGHGALKLLDFPEGIIRVPSAIGDMSSTAISGASTTSAVDMALGSATTLTNSQTLGGANVDFVAKVDEDLVASAGVWDLVNTTSQDEDGHSASTDVWLCVAIEDADMTATGSITLSGTIVITWHNMGDY
jgi:hypothetical protein